MPLTPNKFQRLILHWFDQQGRKDLPWQKNKTPYRVWVSEIMLQQTQVNTVIPYFKNFMKKFPTLRSLAEAHEDEVLHLWTGLGYYSRARHLHRAAKIIMQDFGGQFPDELSLLQKLPGIGRSTAGAILAISFQKKAAILDGNVKRVLTRFLRIHEWPGEKTILEKLWKFSETYSPNQRIADYTQAMMDLGATVCKRGKPLCEICPLEKYCEAHQSGEENKLPISNPKKTLPVRQKTFFILAYNDSILLEKRPAKGIWGGLWSFPEITDLLPHKKIQKHIQENYQTHAFNIQLKKPFRHTFTHFHLDILPVHIQFKTQPQIIENDQKLWYNLKSNSQKIGLPAPVKLLMENDRL